MKPPSTGSYDEEEEEQEIEEFFCVACDKSFKSEKQLQNHEKSKKHLEQVHHHLNF